MIEIRYDAPKPILNINMSNPFMGSQCEQPVLGLRCAQSTSLTHPLAHSEWLKVHPDHEYENFVNVDKIPDDDIIAFLKTLWKNIETPQEAIKDEFNGWAYEEGKWTKIEEPNELCYGYCECVGSESVFYAWDYYNFKWYIYDNYSNICYCK